MASIFSSVTLAAKTRVKSLRFFHRAAVIMLFALGATAVLPISTVHAADGDVGGQAASAVAQKVNINQADVNALAELLTGVGLIKAQAIVEYRAKMGAFERVEQLAEVKGIGPKTVEKNRSRIML